jgi:uncharacterized protein
MALVPPRAQPLLLPGPVGDLESLLEEPADRRSDVFGVICHPHPLGGGTMTNKVVHALARAMHKSGAPTLRFNFRGTGASAGQFDEGRGETDDALAVIAAGRKRWPGAALWLAGFSFGAYVALRVAALAQAQRLITVAPPVGRWDFSGLRPPDCPWLIIQGLEDELVDAAAVVRYSQQSSASPQLETLPGVGHFFHGHLHDIDRLAVDFLGR